MQRASSWLVECSTSVIYQVHDSLRFLVQILGCLLDNWALFFPVRSNLKDLTRRIVGAQQPLKGVDDTLNWGQ